MTTLAANSRHALSEPLRTAIELSGGARFYSCALQINPFDYLKRYNKPTTFASEEDYNKAIVKACLENGIEVIGVTDHFRVKHSWTLIHAARSAGLHAFGGFEGVAKDGVHFLCLFDPDKDSALESYLGSCGIHNTDISSPTGCLDSIELLDHSRDWGAACIAAHVASAGGLLDKLSGQSRINAWKSPNLIACALPGSVEQAPQSVKQILRNTDPEYKRFRAPAIINASDVCDPANLKKNSASCLIKMSNLSIEGLRQAFLDPESRVRLRSDPQPEPHSELVAIVWEGGFLRDTAIHFNGSLNAIVGGRGTGKSTLIESIRYVLGLDPIGEDAGNLHFGVIQHVLRPGTKVSLAVRSHKPSECFYTIERSVPNPPIVKDESGEVLAISPRDIVQGAEVFGQHEISELTKSPDKLTLLLERFMNRDPSIYGRKANLNLNCKSRAVELSMQGKRSNRSKSGLRRCRRLKRQKRDFGRLDWKSG